MHRVLKGCDRRCVGGIGRSVQTSGPATTHAPSIGRPPAQHFMCGPIHGALKSRTLPSPSSTPPPPLGRQYPDRFFFGRSFASYLWPAPPPPPSPARSWLSHVIQSRNAIGAVEWRVLSQGLVGLPPVQLRKPKAQDPHEHAPVMPQARLLGLQSALDPELG